MYSAVLLSYTVYRQGSPINSIAGASLVIMLWRPSELLNPSFQLTFLSIISIVAFGFPLIENLRLIGSWTPEEKRPFPPAVFRPIRLFAEALYWNKKLWLIRRRRAGWHCEIEKSNVGASLSGSVFQRVLRHLFEAVWITLSVQLFLLPLLVYQFHRVGAASVFSNLFAGFAVIIQNITAVITILISLADMEAARAFAAIATNISVASLWVQSLISKNLISFGRLPVYSGQFSLIYGIYYLPLIVVAAAVSFWNPFKRAARSQLSIVSVSGAFLMLIVLSLLILLHPGSKPLPDGRLSVDYLDVGQGDSAFVRFPNGQTLLIDGGGQREFSDESGLNIDRDISGVGESVVSEFLWEKGYDGIDCIISTHPDADHIKGLIDVVKNFRVSTVYVGASFEDVVDFHKLRSAARLRDTQLRILKRGVSLSFGLARLEVLHPSKEFEITKGNDDSIVTRIVF
jgi:competence protein ComEC